MGGGICSGEHSRQQLHIYKAFGAGRGGALLVALHSLSILPSATLYGMPQTAAMPNYALVSAVQLKFTLLVILLVE